MHHKVVTFVRFIPLIVYLVIGTAHAEEGTVLFDSEQGIDETGNPVVKEIQDLTRSLQDIDGVKNSPETDEAPVTTETQEKAQPSSIDDQVTDTPPEHATSKNSESESDTDTPPEPPVDTIPAELESSIAVPTENEGTVLIDTEQGIDETLPAATKELKQLSESFKETNPVKQAKPVPEIVQEKKEPDIYQDKPGATIAAPDAPEEPGVPVLSTDSNKDVTEDITEPSTMSETVSPEPGILPPAPEGTVLIDIEQGIDELDTPADTETETLGKSEADSEVDENDQASPEPEKVIEAEDQTVPTRSTATQSTLLPPIVPTTQDVKYNDIGKKQDGPWIPETGDVRILEVRVGSYWFDEVIDAYQFEDVILLPMGLISELLDIAIEVEPGFANGFILKEDNTFALDISRNQVIIRGVPYQYDTDLVKPLNADIYVESNLLGKWFGMRFNIDLYASRVLVQSDIKLPFLARIEREKRIEATLARLNNASEQNYPRHYEPYKNSTVPFIDQTLRVGQRLSDKGNATSFQYVTHATADMLLHESSWYVSGDDQESIRDFRATFGRTDPDGELLGALNANEYTFGHVVESRVDLVSIPGEQEPGMTVSNFPVGQQLEYDRHRFRGELLPGWEVEIYRNNALIGYQPEPVEGQYDFQDIPLLFGNNHFRLVFYGQKGEIREENIHFLLTQSLTKKGEHYYRASTTTDDVGSNRTSMQYDYGISKNISSSFNLVSIPLQESTGVIQHNYIKAGLVGFWDALFANISLVDDSEGGSAFETNLQTRLGETVFGLKDISFSKFFSEEFLPSSTEITHSTRLTIDTAIPETLLPRIPVSIGYRTDEFANGSTLVEITNQLSANVRGFAISNQLTSQKTTGQQPIQNGALQLSTNIKDIQARGIVNYSLKPESELTNLGLTIDPGQYDDYRLSFGITHTLQQDLTEYSVTANKLSGNYNLSFGARYNSDGDINLDVSYSIGFGYEPRRQHWEQEANALASQGSVSARVYLDKDQDGIFNHDDTPLDSVGFRINGGYNKKRTDEDGIAFLTGIPAHQPTNLVLAPETMSDPLWKTAIDGVRIVPRPGHAIQLDFPVFMSGEADGTVYLKKRGALQGVGRVKVELVDSIGQIINTTETSYDGFYIMPNIPIGQYWLRISAEQLDKLGLVAPNDQSIVISNEEPLVNGIDFTLMQSP